MTQSRLKVFRGIGWVGSAVVVPGRQLLETDVRVVLNVKKPYRKLDYPQNPWPIEPVRNEGLPLYTFSTNGLATVNDNMPAAENAFGPDQCGTEPILRLQWV